MKEYDHKKIENKWQKEWDKKKLYEVKNTAKGKKFYGLIEFPYPSGAGLHVGHIRSNTAMDIISRKRRMEGYNVLYPIGWDAFGLPTENFAIKTGIQPAKVTKQNTDTFRRQLKSLGFSFDWSREVNTTDPAYYKWTQWIFLQMYKKGLAYKAKTEINWCPKDKIGLANEEAEGGICDRCGGPTEKRVKEQWMLAITKYADRLDKDLDDVNYLEKIKIQQRNWIGKSVGSEIDFAIKNSEEKIKVFTTRADTLFGVTYVVLAPEHELVNNLKSQISNWVEVEKYLKDVKKKTDIERTDEGKEKTGVQLEGIHAINPANNEEVPVYVADYVLPHYGTGAVMAVPAHDERDFAFAKKYNLQTKNVVENIRISESGSDAIRKDLPIKIYKNAVFVIIKHWSEDKYLCIKWKGSYWQNFITGGIEKGESALEAAQREVVEESGYTNIKKIKDLSQAVHSRFYHEIKGWNQQARFHSVYVELGGGEQIEISKEEKALHDLIWIDKKEVETFINVSNAKYAWRLSQGLESECFTEEGILVNSGNFDGLLSSEANKNITEFVGGKIVTKFKLRDWVFSRQRYWGEPIPIVNCEKCGYVPLSEKDLPLELPKVKSYAPTDNGESPLANITAWVNTKCPKCKGKAKRETDTMPNWAGSSWYFLRYTDPKNKKEFANKNVLKYWMKNGVDWYNGGMEHTTLHLLYSRFWHKFLYDLKVVPTSEPYIKRTSHGMILAEGGEKMSKSVGNTVNPDEIVKLYGADTLRMYEMFMGPFDQAVSWSTESMIGPRRFLERVWRLKEKLTKQNNQNFSALNPLSGGSDTQKNYDYSASLVTTLNKTIKKVTEDIENMNFNTAVSAMMVLLNEMEKCESVNLKDYKMFLQILAPFAPHVTEELWFKMGGSQSIHLSKWPKFDPKKLENETVKIGVQVNGKVRSELVVGKDESEDSVKEKAMQDENVIKWIDGKVIKKIIYVKGRLLNIVI
jgi:leucyl-tRNA synthetase